MLSIFSYVYLPSGSLWIFFGKESIKVSGPFILIGLFFFFFFSFIHMCIHCLGHFSTLPPPPFLLLSLKNSLCILDISILMDMCFSKIFSHSVACLFTVCNSVFYRVEVFHFNKVQLYLTFFCAFGVRVQFFICFIH
jgi:hypothetical protein